MKIAVLICGEFRFLDTVYNRLECLFPQYHIDYFLSIDNSNEKNSEYEHKNDYNVLKTCDKIKQIYFHNKSCSNEFRNVKNYVNKIVNGCSMLKSNYNIYIIIRSDLILEKGTFIEDILNTIGENEIYLSKQNQNPFILNIKNKVNGNCIITKNYHHIEIFKTHLQEYINKHELDYFDVILYKFLNIQNITIKLIEIQSHLYLSLCNIIAISGDSGSGKSSLSESLYQLFDHQNNILKLETDRYHKWERGDQRYLQFTHLNPEANYLQKMEDDVYNLKIGNCIYTVDYDHGSGKFTSEETIRSKKNVILCGLHTFWSQTLRPLIDLKIYMDTERQLIMKWKLKRDVEQRGKTKSDVEYEMDKRKNDYFSYIHVQKNDADMIIHFFDTHNIKCKCIVKEKYNDSLLYILTTLSYKYSIDPFTKSLEIILFGSSKQLLSWMISKKIINMELSSRIYDEFYGELQLLIYLIITM